VPSGFTNASDLDQDETASSPHVGVPCGPDHLLAYTFPGGRRRSSDSNGIGGWVWWRWWWQLW